MSLTLVTNEVVKNILERIQFDYKMSDIWRPLFLSYVSSVLNANIVAYDDKDENFNYENYLTSNANLLREKFYVENDDLLSSRITERFDLSFYISAYPQVNLNTEVINNFKFIHNRIILPIAKKLNLLGVPQYLVSTEKLNSRLNPNGYINPEFKRGTAIQFQMASISAKELYSLIKSKEIDIPIGICVVVNDDIYIRIPSYREDYYIKDWFFESGDHTLKNLFEV